jgi:hypothetical protein
VDCGDLPDRQCLLVPTTPPGNALPIVRHAERFGRTWSKKGRRQRPDWAAAPKTRRPIAFPTRMQPSRLLHYRDFPIISPWNLCVRSLSRGVATCASADVTDHQTAAATLSADRCDRIQRRVDPVNQPFCNAGRHVSTICLLAVLFETSPSQSRRQHA